MQTNPRRQRSLPSKTPAETKKREASYASGGGQISKRGRQCQEASGEMGQIPNTKCQIPWRFRKMLGKGEICRKLLRFGPGRKQSNRDYVSLRAVALGGGGRTGDGRDHVPAADRGEAFPGGRTGEGIGRERRQPGVDAGAGSRVAGGAIRLEKFQGSGLPRGMRCHSGARYGGAAFPGRLCCGK